MSTCLLLISDGRDEYRARTLQSAKENLPSFDHRIEVDDREHRLGFAGAIARGWQQVIQAGCDYCMHLEADFVFERPVPLGQMEEVLRANPYLVQMALLRQPWNAEEQAAGGIIQQHPQDYEQMNWNGHRWIEHRRFFTTNPSLIPTWAMRSGWPQCAESEGHFGLSLFASDGRLRSAFWGDGEPWVEHIGRERIGCGY